MIGYEREEKKMADPERWGLFSEQAEAMPDDLRQHWEDFQACFSTKMRDPSEQAYAYLRGMQTMEKDRHFAGISRTV